MSVRARRVLAFTLCCALVVGAPARAAEARPTLADLEDEIMCPICETTLDQSDSPAAQQIERLIQQRIAAGDTEAQIKRRLVDEYGEGILASPPRAGFNLLAWLLPVAGGVVGAVAVGAAAWRWTRSREARDGVAGLVDPSANGRSPLDPELDRRVDEALARFE